MKTKSIFRLNARSPELVSQERFEPYPQWRAHPNIARITFHTLKHFYATMKYHRTQNIVPIKEKPGHHCILNIIIYTHLVSFESDDFHVAHAENLQEEDDL